MELRHLRYFVAVAEELHFSRAAARLNIAAPTLSAQIQSLEAMLGAQLFTRKTRSVALTQVGKRFLEEARATLKQADQAELVGRQAARGDIGSIAVGYVLSASCGGLVSQPIIEFKKSHPNVSFSSAQDGDHPADEGAGRRIARYRLHPGAASAIRSDLTGFMVDRQPFYLAIPETHRLASNGDIAPEQYRGRAVHRHAARHGDRAFGATCGRSRPRATSMRVVARVPDALSVLTSVSAGIGLGVLSEALTRDQRARRGVSQGQRRSVAHSDHAVVYRKNEGATGHQGVRAPSCAPRVAGYRLEPKA